MIFESATLNAGISLPVLSFLTTCEDSFISILASCGDMSLHDSVDNWDVATGYTGGEF